MEDLGGFFNREATEVAELDEAGLAGVLLLELVEGEVEIDEQGVGRGVGRGRFGDGLDGEFEMGGALGGFAGAGMIDEDATDHVGGDGEEVGAAGVGGTALINEAEVGFMNKDGGLDGEVGILTGELTARDGAQLIVDDGHEALEGGGITVAPGVEKLGNVLGARHSLQSIVQTQG